MKEFADVEARVKNYHAEILLKHGDSPQGVDWKDAQSQELRFSLLADLFNTSEDFTFKGGKNRITFPAVARTSMPFCWMIFCNSIAGSFSTIPTIRPCSART